MASTYLTRTISDGGNTKSTFSAWVKRTGLGSTQYLFHTSENSSNDVKIIFNSADNFRVIGVVSGSTVMNVSTNRKFRDTNAWYHFVVTIDLTQSTEADRVKIYVNGVQETSFSTAVIPSQNYSSLRLNNNGDRRTIGTIYDGGGSAGSGYFDGLMSHVHWIDGTAYQASTFGSTDATTGEWKINTSPTLTMGTNGFTILKDGNTITDQSANSNNFTASGTLTKSEDNPSNIFATWNSLVPSGGGYQGNSSTFRYGSCDFVTNNSSSNYGLCTSSLGMTSGKWYMEISYESNSNQCLIGIMGNKPTSTANYVGGHAHSYGLYTSGSYYNATSGTSYGTSFTNGDYIGIFLDLDNNKLYFSKNGTVMNSGTGISIAAASATDNGCYFFACTEWNSSGNGDFGANFGNGVFRTTALTGTTYDDADGIGIFKYEPTGLSLDGSTKSFKALCTKGLNN